jgi:hypothetical protein
VRAGANPFHKKNLRFQVVEFDFNTILRPLAFFLYSRGHLVFLLPVPFEAFQGMFSTHSILPRVKAWLNAKI